MVTYEAMENPRLNLVAIASIHTHYPHTITIYNRQYGYTTPSMANRSKRKAARTNLIRAGAVHSFIDLGLYVG